MNIKENIREKYLFSCTNFTLKQNPFAKCHRLWDIFYEIETYQISTEHNSSKVNTMWCECRNEIVI